MIQTSNKKGNAALGTGGHIQSEVSNKRQTLHHFQAKPNIAPSAM